MSSPQYLTVEEVGPAAFRRWRIVNGQHHAWTGHGWSPAPAAGLLFGSNRAACFQAQKLLMADHAHRPVRRFVAPAYVDVFCDGDFTPEQLRAWLVRAARLHVDYAGTGFGPLDDSLGLLQIEWGSMKEVRS